MSIGTTIKRLRREKDITQEQLAEYLGITSRAVSQWECDRTSPDISQIPALCHIFGTTADELLGIDTISKEAEIENYKNEINDLLRTGQRKEAFEVAQAAYRKYPDSYRTMLDFATTSGLIINEKLCSPEERNLLLAKAINALENIISGCTDEIIRGLAKTNIIDLYMTNGQSEKAKEIAGIFPSLVQGREFYWIRTCKGDDKINSHRDLLFHGLIRNLVTHSTENFKDDSGKKCYSTAEMNKLYEKQITLLELIFEDGDFGEYFEDISEANIDIANFYAESGDAEQTLEHLDRAADATISFLRDYYQKEYKHTSLLFKNYTPGDSHFWHYRTNNNGASVLLDKLKNEKFDFVRNDIRFTQIEERLTPYVGTWK